MPTSTAPLAGWLSVVAITLGIFSIVTVEILPIGLLTSIAASYHVSDGTAGWLMTVPGLVAAVAAPSVTLGVGRLDRRFVLCGLMGLLAAANFLAAAAGAFWVLLFARVVVGLVIGGFWSVGAGLASRLVPTNVGAATAVIFSAVPLGSVLGVPAGTAMGELLGWRWAFVGLGVLTVGVLVALIGVLPSVPPEPAVRFRKLLRRRGIRSGLLVTVLVVAAHFGTYTYVTPFLEQAGARPVSVFLLVYGIAGIVGNFVAGATVGRGLRRTFLVCAGLIGVATLVLPVTSGWEYGVVGLLVLWGIGYGAVPTCSQTWFAMAAPDAREAATVLFTSSFQATIAGGALLGGVVVDSSSVSVVLVCGGVLAVLAALVICYQA